MSTPGTWLDRERVAEIEAGGTDAFRVAWGPGFEVERFGRAVMMSAVPGTDFGPIDAAFRAWCGRVGWEPEAAFRRQLVKGPREGDTPVLVAGEVAGPSFANECGLRYEVDFSSGYSAGIFCDQRANRMHLRELKPARVLNTFAYTCAFSVVAAFSGAETVSVDASKASLQRGRRNFESNGLDLARHKFIQEDVMTYLVRLGRRGEVFDAIILDPPTFGRGGGGRVFRVECDFEELVAAALRVAAPGASVLLSTNYRRWSVADLAACARKLAGGSVPLREIPPHADYAVDCPSISLWMGPVV